MRRGFVVNAGRSAGKDDSVRFQLRDLVRRNIEANDLGIDLQLTDAARDYLRVLRTEIEDENFRVSRCVCGLHALRVGLRDAMLAGRIVGRFFQRTKRSLTSQAALQLLLHFLCAALFERVRAAAPQETREREGHCEGLHLLIL